MTHDELADLLIATCRGEWPARLPPRGRNDTAADGVQWLLEEHADELGALAAAFEAALDQLLADAQVEPLKTLAQGLAQARQLGQQWLIGRAIYERIGSITDQEVAAEMVPAWIEHYRPEPILRYLEDATWPVDLRAALAMLTIRRRMPETMPAALERWAGDADPSDLDLTLTLWIKQSAINAWRLRGYIESPESSSEPLREAARRVMRHEIATAHERRLCPKWL